MAFPGRSLGTRKSFRGDGRPVSLAIVAVLAKITHVPFELIPHTGQGLNGYHAKSRFMIRGITVTRSVSEG